MALLPKPEKLLSLLAHRIETPVIPIVRELLDGRSFTARGARRFRLSALMKLVAKRFIAVDCPLPHSDWLQMFRARPSLLP